MTRCKYWDSGWCYHPDGPSNGCVGVKDCSIIATDKVKDDDER